MKNVKRILFILIVALLMSTGTTVNACPASSQKVNEEVYVKAQRNKSVLINFKVSRDKKYVLIKAKKYHFVLRIRG